MRRTLLAATAAIALSAATMLGAAPARAADYTIDPSHTHILFMVDHLGFSKMIGLFTGMTGMFSFDPANVAASKVKVTIKTDSLSTQFGPRDADLKGADWFNVTEFPEMTFAGTSYAKTDEHTGTITGNLTLLGVTKPVTLNVTFNKAAVRPTDKKQAAGFSANGKFKRSEFGMKTYIPYIGDEVSLVIETEGTSG
jgi:polyisoprenoid-binding protein YceI